MPLGLVGGFVDATGGGGWGPVSTTALLSAGKTAPRTVIGSVDTSEFLVSTAASIGFVAALGTAGIDWWIVLSLLAGGVIAAPIAAWLVSRIPAQVMGVAVGGLIVITNLRTLFSAGGITGASATVGYVVIVVLWVGLTAWQASPTVATWALQAAEDQVLDLSTSSSFPTSCSPCTAPGARPASWSAPELAAAVADRLPDVRVRLGWADVLTLPSPRRSPGWGRGGRARLPHRRLSRHQ